MRRPLVLPCLLFASLVLIGGVAARAAPDPASPDSPPAAAADSPKAPHPSSDIVKKELTDIIDAQLSAFRAGDYAKGYEFAASGIRNMFGAADFAVMVQNGYPVIAHSARAEYGLAFDTGEEAVVNVHIEDAAKRSGEFQYLLKKENGGWKISGVSELKSTDLSV